jgi:hypothetical protein
MHGVARKSQNITDFVIVLQPFIIAFAQPGFQSSRSFGFPDRQQPAFMGTVQYCQPAEISRTISQRKPTGPHIWRTLNMDEVLMRRRGSQSGIGKHDPGDISGVWKRFGSQEPVVNGHEARMMRKGVKQF